MNTDSLPIVIKEIKKRFFLGLVRFAYLVENRRPDLFENDYDTYDSKYKHYIVWTVFSKKYSWTFHTKYPYEDIPYEL